MRENKIYQGIRTRSGCEVTVNGQPLDPRWDLLNHSPDGFEWGYGGSGPAQLALALLVDLLGDDRRALQSYHDFKWKFVAGLDQEEWFMTEKDLRQFVSERLDETEARD